MFVLAPFSILSIFALHSCECIGTDERLDFMVFAGERSNCRELMKNNSASHPDITYVCPGEKVTLCWSSNKIPTLTMDIGGATHTVAATGSEVITVPASTVIKLTPSGGNCVTSSREFKVTVISGPTPSTWQASWDCATIRFAISDAFMSTNIIAKDITATWIPDVDYSDASGTRQVICTTPPFLKGIHQEEVYGFNIDQPNVTRNFTRDLKAVGHWNFNLLATCPAGEYKCNQLKVFPFNLTLDCRKP